MECWKCHEMNHIYYVDNPFYSACNVEIQPDEAMWESNSISYLPEIVAFAESIVKNNHHLKLGQIKKRYSNTVQESYTSFGCCKCDSIFGDWYIMEAVIDMLYEPKPLTFEGDIELHEDVILNIPHWCYPDNQKFCDD